MGLNNILGYRKGKDALAFLDDTSIGTKMEEKQFHSLGYILDNLLKVGGRIKLSKFPFGVRKANIPGHVVDEEGIRPS